MPITNKQLRQYQAMYASREPSLPPEKLAAYRKEYNRMYLHPPALPMLWRQTPARPVIRQVATNCLLPRLVRRMARLFADANSRYALPEIMQQRIFFADTLLDTVTGVDWQTSQFVLDLKIPPWPVIRSASVNLRQQESGEIELQSSQLCLTVMQMAVILSQNRLTADDVMVVRRPSLGRPAWTFYTYRYELVAQTVSPMSKRDDPFILAPKPTRNRFIRSFAWYLYVCRERPTLALREASALLTASPSGIKMHNRLLTIASHLKANVAPAAFTRMRNKGLYHAIQPDTVHREEPFPRP